MSGVSCLLDTNVILGMLKSAPEVVGLVSPRWKTGPWRLDAGLQAVMRDAVGVHDPK